MKYSFISDSFCVAFKCLPENRIAFLIDYLKQSLKEKNLTSISKILVLWRLYVFLFFIREEQTIWEYEDWFAWSMNWKSRHKIQVFFWVSIVVVLVNQSCLTLFHPMDWGLPGSSEPRNSPGENTRVGCHSLLHLLSDGLPSCLFGVWRMMMWKQRHLAKPRVS